MKNLSLVLAFLFTTLLFSQLDYDGFVGKWESEGTKYTLIISKQMKKNHFKFLNYKEVFSPENPFYGKPNQTIDIVYSPEEFVKSESGKLHTFIAWQYGEQGMKDYYCDVVYEFVNENKLKASLSGSTEMVLYYTKTNDK